MSKSLDLPEMMLREAEGAVEAALYLAEKPILSHVDFYAALEGIDAIFRRHGAKPLGDAFVKHQVQLVENILEPAALWSVTMKFLAEKFNFSYKTAGDMLIHGLEDEPERAEKDELFRRLLRKLDDLPLRWNAVGERVRNTPGFAEMDERARRWHELNQQLNPPGVQPLSAESQKPAAEKPWWQFWSKRKR